VAGMANGGAHSDGEGGEGGEGGGKQGVGACFPARPEWILWWKGEGDSKPLTRFSHNVYWSLRPLEQMASEGGELAAAPPWLHLARRGVNLARWARGGQDDGSVWRDPGFVGEVARCSAPALHAASDA